MKHRAMVVAWLLNDSRTRLLCKKEVEYIKRYIDDIERNNKTDMGMH